MIEVGEEFLKCGRVDRSEEYDMTLALLLLEAASELISCAHNFHNLRDCTREQRLFTKSVENGVYIVHWVITGSLVRSLGETCGR